VDRDTQTFEFALHMPHHRSEFAQAMRLISAFEDAGDPFVIRVDHDVFHGAFYSFGEPETASHTVVCGEHLSFLRTSAWAEVFHASHVRATFRVMPNPSDPRAASHAFV
jgi:hypothetical protein